MSCDWTIKCVDCDVRADIENANHGMTTMQLLVGKGRELGELFKHFKGARSWVTFQLDDIFVPTEFFIEHGSHRLRPIDEYGQFDTPCEAKFWCQRCGAEVSCDEREHPGRSLHGHAVNHIFHWQREDSGEP